MRVARVLLFGLALLLLLCSPLSVAFLGLGVCAAFAGLVTLILSHGRPLGSSATETSITDGGSSTGYAALFGNAVNKAPPRREEPPGR